MRETFPRLTNRGPIEAVTPAQELHAVTLFPRLTNRGPIEATEM